MLNTQYSNNMNNVFKILKITNQERIKKIMILFDNIMVEIKIPQKVIGLFFCGSKLDIPIALSFNRTLELQKTSDCIIVHITSSREFLIRVIH